MSTQPDPAGDPLAAPGESPISVPVSPAGPGADAGPGRSATPGLPAVADVPEVSGPGLLARVGAELFGTFVLVFAGAGTMLYSQVTDAGGTLAVAVAFGVAAAIGLVTVGRVSGGHLNPAVSLGAAIAGRLSWADLLPYWLAQLVGGAIGASVLFLTVPSELGTLINKTDDRRDVFGATANGFGPHSPLAHAISAQGINSTATFSLAAALLVEVVATGIFVGVFLATTRRAAEPRAPFAVGLTFSALMLVALPITNGGLNPARSTATAILSQSWALSQLWLFWVAPLIGAALAALLYRAFVSPPPLLLDEEDVPDDEDDLADDDLTDDEGDEGEGETLPVLPA